MRTVTIFSRHPSHGPLRGSIEAPKGYTPIVRFGSVTESDKKIQINSVKAIETSMNKLAMKKAFSVANVKTPYWCTLQDFISMPDDSKFFPCVVKNIWGSRGTGNYIIYSQEELDSLLPNKRVENYIVEEFCKYSREYRFHVSTEGVFLTWRKLRREGTPEKDMWFFNNQTCNWVGKEHESYKLSREVYQIACEESIKALNAVGLDFGAVDIKVSVKSNDVSIIEINSAPSLGEVGIEVYKTEIKKLIQKKLR